MLLGGSSRPNLGFKNEASVVLCGRRKHHEQRTTWEEMENKTTRKRLCETMDSRSVVNASSVFTKTLKNSAMLSIIKSPRLQVHEFATFLFLLALFSLHHSLIGRRLPSSTLLRTRGTDIRIRITRHDQTRINRFGHVRELET